MARRCYWVRMDAQSARPWQRPPEDFKHPDLRAWVTSERDRILSAILTLARSWILAGRPEPRTLPPMGSYERWRSVIGGMMEFCGVKEFLGNLEEMYSEADTETPQWEAFFETWYSIWRDNPVKVSDIHNRLEIEGDSTNSNFCGIKLQDSLPDTVSDAFGKKRSFVRILGNSLSKRKGRVLPNGYMLKKGRMEHKVITWIVSRTGGLTGLGGLGESGLREEKIDPQKRLPQTPQTPITPLSDNDQEGSR
jgi:hypothetical protein